MRSSSIPPRHRAFGAPRTALDDAAAAASTHLATATRRTAVVAGTSGLLVSMVAGSASAASPADNAHLPSVDTSTLVAAARTALRTSPVVLVPVEATWTFEAPAITVVADPPPAPAPTRAAAPARTATRVSVPPSAQGGAIMEIASRYIGVPYVAGGTTPDGFDCSGFTKYVYAQVGITLPRTSSEQHDGGTIIPADQAQPGDLIWHPGHIGIYAGGDLLIDSPEPGGTVQIRKIYFSNPVFIRYG